MKILALVAVALGFLIWTLGVLCIVLAARAKVSPWIATVLILWLPLQLVIIALAPVIMHDADTTRALLWLAPFVSYFGVFVVMSFAAYGVARTMRASLDHSPTQ